MAVPQPVAAVIGEGCISTRSETTVPDIVAKGDEPMEFHLNSNWGLSPEGVEDFYKILHRCDQNVEVAYESRRGFRIQCRAHEEASVVAAVKNALDQLVQRLMQNGLLNTAKVYSIQHWLEDKIQLDGDPKISDKYAYPRDVALCEFRDAWNIPERCSNNGITTGMVLPASTLSEIQRLTGATLILSANQCTVYIGASETEKIAVAKQKLNVMIKFFLLAPKDTAQVIKVILHGERDKSPTGEYRLMLDGNKTLLRGYILDRFEWPFPSNRYPFIFKHATVVRLDSGDEPRDKDHNSSTTTELISMAKDAEEFMPFRKEDWRYSITETSSRSQLQQSNRVANIENLVSTLSALTDASHILPSKAGNPANTQPTKSTTSVDDNRTFIGASQSPQGPARQTSDGPQRGPDDAKPVVVPEQSQPTTNDPFQHLWKQCRRRLVDTNLMIQKNQSDQTKLEPGFRVDSGNIRDKFDGHTITTLNKSLVSLMTPWAMWPGTVDLRIDLGRFCFLDVDQANIQELGKDSKTKHYGLVQIENELNKTHTTNAKLHFTKVLTTLSADANYIASLDGQDGNKLWASPADGRSSVYEFICRSRTADGADCFFAVDVDALTFTTKVRPFKCHESYLAVHCLKRAWDFRIVLSASQDLDNACAQFSQDLARSLTVSPAFDRIPELKVSYGTSYGVEILAVRTRNTASYVSELTSKNAGSAPNASIKDNLRLYIGEIWEMALLSKAENRGRVTLKFAQHKQHEAPPSAPLMWYEAFLKSNTLSKAFKQNEDLELGNEASWTAEGFLKSGVLHDLVRKAADMVRMMDGIGYRNDNQQQKWLTKAAETATGPRDEDPEKFW